MLTPQQKIYVAAVGVTVIAQSAATVTVLAHYKRAQSMANAAAKVFNRHDSVLTDIDRHELIAAGFRRI